MASIIRFTLGLVLSYLLVLAWLWNHTEQDPDNLKRDTLSNSQEYAKTQARLTQSQAKLQNGYLISDYDNEKFHSKDLAHAISLIPNGQAGTNYLWQDRAGNAFAYAAMGIDRNHYFANSYLVGYEPYKTNKIWQPLVTLALRKTYQFDHDQHGPTWRDVWQNSRQAYFYSHGDCEDHAILLADWLISMNYDARVAIGRVPSGGHAWVILFHDGKEYLLESTSKRRPRSIGDFKLAKYAPDYQPEFLFNRQHFWVNTGTKLTTSYSDSKWKKTAMFIANKQKRDRS